MSRVHAPAVHALCAPAGGIDIADNVEVRAPAVGVWHPAVARGQLVRPGDAIGELVVLGSRHKVVAPEGAYGVVVGIADGAERRAAIAVSHGARLLVLDPAHAIGGAADAPSAARAAAQASGLSFVAPTSGRFYGRPGPGKAAFVQVGDVLRDGATVCLLEVMKTFNRVVYDAAGMGLPAAARVLEVVARDEADVDAGAVLLRLEAAE